MKKGKLMLKTLHMYRHKTSIFDDFQYYESKQAEEKNPNRRQGSTNIQQQNENNEDDE